MDGNIQTATLPIRKLRKTCETLQKCCLRTVAHDGEGYIAAKEMSTTALLNKMTDFSLSDRVYLRENGFGVGFQNEYICLLLPPLERLGEVFTLAQENETVNVSLFIDHLAVSRLYLGAAIDNLSSALLLTKTSVEKRQKHALPLDGLWP
ncbi:MAG: hypothetical protein LBI39_04595 [Puniceicoccales bacterium]|nr:hypothetical protein [Puniceicoccales bacterium]